MRGLRNGLMAASLVSTLAFLGCGHSSKGAAQNGANAAQSANQPAQPADSSAQPAAGGAQASGQAATPAAAAPAAAAPAQPATYQVTIPDGAAIEVRLQESLGSARSARGELFHATLTEPLVVNGEEDVPAGTHVTGRVLLARPSGHLKTPAELAVTLTSFELNGQRYSIVTSRHSWRGRSHKKHNAKWIAGATGAGALVGALVGHGEGALIGAGIGAGGGTATAYATGKKDITLPSETRLRFVLREPVVVTEYQPS